MDVRQCPSRLVQEVDMPPGLLFGEGAVACCPWARRVLLEQEIRCRQSTMWWLTPGFWCSARAWGRDCCDCLKKRKKEESQHLMHDGPQTMQGDDATKTQDSRRSIVDVPKFDMTRGSNEELIPVDSPGSEVEFEESIAVRRQPKFRRKNSQMFWTFEQQCCEQHIG